MSDIKNIISIRDVTTEENVPSLSGLDLMDAPEISIINLANIANEEYTSGLALARKKIEQATLLVRNDLMSALVANHVIPNLDTKRHSTGEFKQAITFPAEAKERGLTLYKNSRIHGALRKLKIHTAKVYPLADAADVQLKIYDDYAGGMVTTYKVNLTANRVNVFDISYEIKGSYARVVLDGSNVPVASSYLTCFTGCNGMLPNDCGYTKGWYGDKEISGKEGFGVNLEFSCECDYDQMLCDLSKLYVGELVWLKTRVLLLEEHLRTNRLNNWVIYGRDETKDYLTDIENQYREKWKVFAGALRGIISGMKDDCLVCNGIRWVTNI